MKLTNYLFYLLITLVANLSCSKSEQMFTLMTPQETGVDWRHSVMESEEFNVLTYGNFYYGGGVAVGDINNDGLEDIYLSGNMSGNALFLNKGDFTFEDITQKAGVSASGLWNTGVTMADVNGDGLLDIYLSRSASIQPKNRENLLYINNGDLTFTEKGAEFNVNDSGYSTQAAFFDYDKDGDLDLYVLNHSLLEFANLNKITSYHKSLKNEAYSDRLYRNDDGKFINVSEEAGLISNVLGNGLGVAISDLNNDNWPDIYISNDFNEQDYLYINNKNGTFTESLQEFIGHTSLYSMGSDIGDINNDGYFDIVTLDMLPESNFRMQMTSGPDNYEKLSHLSNNGFYNQTMRNMLQLNQSGKYFSEIGQFSGISNTDWSWAALLSDFDNDGHKDLFITNGYKKDYTNMDFMNYLVQEKLNERVTGKKTKITDLIKSMPSTFEENYMFKNIGNLKFQKMNTEWGFNQKTLSNGAAYADLDNDGDMDLIINNIDEKAFLYRNNSETLTANNYIKIKLKGREMNSFGVGAKVTVFTNGIEQTQEVMNTRGFQSAVDLRLNFGLGNYKVIDSIVTYWPDNSRHVVNSIQSNQELIIYQENSKAYDEVKRKDNITLFHEVNLEELGISFSHTENLYNDYKNDILLPKMLSTLGPTVSTGDLNGDGIEDFFIGGAHNSSGEIYFQNKSGNFTRSDQKTFEIDKVHEDIGSLLFDADGDGDLDLYVVSGGNEFQPDDQALQDRLYINNGLGIFEKSSENLPLFLTSGSIVKAADFDGDGDLDLFVGGRVIPGEYPLSPKSYLLQNNGNGIFKDVTELLAPELKTIGMVTDALWTDYDNNGTPDLILVGEWMPVTVFTNSSGNLKKELNQENGLVNSEGWWSSISQADFDNDGDMDYVLGNHGLNSQLKTSTEFPVHLIAKDFDNNGSIDPILCKYENGKKYPVFSKDDMQSQLVMLKSRFVKYSDYASKTVEDIFSEEELDGVISLKASTFSSSYMENLGQGKFNLTPLPLDTQLSPIYSITSGDYNSDGNMDIILGGNFTKSRVKFGHYDAIRGVFLAGDGKGNFIPINVTKSGIMISGEIRDIKPIKTITDSDYLIFSRNNESPELIKYKKIK